MRDVGVPGPWSRPRLSVSVTGSVVGELREVVILDHKVVQIVSEVVGTSGTSVTVKDAEEADLGPLDV